MSTIRRYIKDIIGYLLVPLLSYKLRNDLTKIYSIDKAIEYSYNFVNEINFLPSRVRKIFTIEPAQIKEEIAKLLEIVRELRPRAFLEICTANGGTLFLFARVAAPDALIISVDISVDLQKFGSKGRCGGYPFWRVVLYTAFVSPGQRIVLRADSHDPRTLEEVKRVLGGRQLDFLFIDGDHTYEGVKKDFEMYVSLVRRGGIVAFHDIVPGPPENVGGVPTFWNEIKHSHRYLEIVKDWNQGGYGIGVLYM